MKNIKYWIGLAAFLWIGFSACHLHTEETSTRPSIAMLIQNLKDVESDQIMVIAHRGDWRNAPENSLQALQNCIDMGVDMVEIDVRETKDGALVLMHDHDINRTTNGMGMVKNWTLDSLKTLRLLDGLGVMTSHRIPTLEEALLLAKGKIMVNLDKSYGIFDKCYEIIEKTQTQEQVIIKGSKSREEVENEFGEYIEEVYFMPIVHLSDPNANTLMGDYLDHKPPIAFELIIPHDSLVLKTELMEIRRKRTAIWVNALWPYLNGGHDDEKASINPQVYDWYIENHINMIQTDRPQLLISHLREKGLHW